MSLLSRVGGLLKKTHGRSVASGFSAEKATLFQSIRWMSSSKLFVGGISYGTDEMSLKEAFSQYGELVEARVVLDRETGRSRGFAFVTYTSTEDASSAIQALDGKEMDGRQIRVNYATERPRARGFGYGGQGPSYNQGGGGFGGRGDGFGRWGGGNQYGGGDDGYSGGNNSSNLRGFGNDNYTAEYDASNTVNGEGGSEKLPNLESILDSVSSNNGGFSRSQSRSNSSYDIQEPMNSLDSNPNEATWNR